MQIVKELPRLRDYAKMAIKWIQQSMKNAYPVKFIKQIFKIEDQVIIQWTSACTQGKFVLRRRGPFKIIAILRNGTYKVGNKCEILKVLINRNLLKLYKNYEFMELIIVID